MRQQTSTRPRWAGAGLRIRRSLAIVLTLAAIGGAALCATALIRGTWLVTPVLSGSMRPGFPVGGVVICDEVPVNTLEVRDVIVFSEPGRPTAQVVHRIVKLSRNSAGQLLITTQGDANPVQDPWTLTIDGSTVYEARWSVPLIGYLAIVYQDHRGAALIAAGIVAMALALSAARDERSSAKNRPAGAHGRRSQPSAEPTPHDPVEPTLDPSVTQTDEAPLSVR